MRKWLARLIAKIPALPSIAAAPGISQLDPRAVEYARLCAAERDAGLIASERGAVLWCAERACISSRRCVHGRAGEPCRTNRPERLGGTPVEFPNHPRYPREPRTFGTRTPMTADVKDPAVPKFPNQIPSGPNGYASRFVTDAERTLIDRAAEIRDKGGVPAVIDWQQQIDIATVLAYFTDYAEANGDAKALAWFRAWDEGDPAAHAELRDYWSQKKIDY